MRCRPPPRNTPAPAPAVRDRPVHRGRRVLSHLDRGRGRRRCPGAPGRLGGPAPGAPPPTRPRDGRRRRGGARARGRDDAGRLRAAVSAASAQNPFGVMPTLAAATSISARSAAENRGVSRSVRRVTSCARRRPASSSSATPWSSAPATWPTPSSSSLTPPTIGRRRAHPRARFAPPARPTASLRSDRAISGVLGPWSRSNSSGAHRAGPVCRSSPAVVHRGPGLAGETRSRQAQVRAGRDFRC